jgi:hypothetical protein
MRDFAEIKFDILRDRKVWSNFDERADASILTPSALSTVGLRRATEARTIKVFNRCGLDIHVDTDTTVSDPNSGLVSKNSMESILFPIDYTGSRVDNEMKLVLRLSQSARELVGDREPIYDLPVAGTSAPPQLHLLRPLAMCDSKFGGMESLLRVFESRGRTSPETAFTGGTISDLTFNNAEPVVEWCMHNQRLRSGLVDVFSLDKGRDFLSSSLWSPEDEINEDFVADVGPARTVKQDETTATPIVDARRARLTPTREQRPSTLHTHTSNWLRPYLTNDSPEWTDMTCTLRMARERVMLPDSNWIWVNDWAVDLNGKLGESTDTDGWEYEGDFETFGRTRRYYQRGDACRRRRWTRTRIVKPPRLNDPLRQLKFVWEPSHDDNGNYTVTVRSHVRVKNMTDSPLSLFAFSPSWEDDMYIGSVTAGGDLFVPVHLASAVYMRITKHKLGIQQSPQAARDCIFSERFVILPTSYTSSNYVRASLALSDVSVTTLHYLIEIQSNRGIVDVVIFPVLKVVNLLPCLLECQFGEVLCEEDSRSPDRRKILGMAKWETKTKKIAPCETFSVTSGKDGCCTAFNPEKKPHISIRVPGFEWSPWQRVVNRKANSGTWRPSNREEDWHFNSNGDASFADELKTVIRLERIVPGGDPLNLILSVECGHCPTLRIYSQYWIIDKSGFGCRFAEGFADIFGTIPDRETSRRSHLQLNEAKSSTLKKDFSLSGHQWAIGMSGMTMYFSRREKLALAIETGVRDRRAPRTSQRVKSKWVSPLDISNVVPKTVFSVDELGGPRRFELAISVTVCPGLFSRTKLITLLPRYQIVNLLHRELVIAQDGCLDSETLIPSQTAVPFHWEKGSLAPKVRIGAPSGQEKAAAVYEDCWTNGRFRVDRVGITSMRLPTGRRVASTPLVVQAEVRLATKDQSSAVVVVIWAANAKSNPLYMLRNRTPYTILCRQPLREDQHTNVIVEGEDEGFDLLNSCNVLQNGFSDQNSTGRSIQCSTEIGPLLRSLLGLNHYEEFVWILQSNEVACFGFDDPEKPHLLEWTCVSRSETNFDGRLTKATLEIDAMGSSSVFCAPNGQQVLCMIHAEHSTKVVEFTELSKVHTSVSSEILSSGSQSSPVKHGLTIMQKLDSASGASRPDHEENDEDPAFSLRLDIPGICLSVVDNVDPVVFGREILLVKLDRFFSSFSQTREGYHEFEFRLVSLQIDNHVHKSIHPVLLFCPPCAETEPLLHMSAVRRLQQHSKTYVFRYAAIRLLEIDLYLDRRTAECIAHFIEPLTLADKEEIVEPRDWVSKLTAGMGRKFAQPDRHAPRDIEKTIHTANSGRIYFEQLHLHPVRLGLTFTQEWMEWSPGTETMMVFQFIRGMASIANAPLTFTSFVVAHVFEAPQALGRVIVTHFSSQLTKQVFGILGSLAILGAPADFISNVGTGVRDFFYEPIQGAVLGPKQFIEGLEAGTQSLARGVFVGVVRGAANVTDVLNSNLAGLTADYDFIDERKAHQRMLTDAMSRGAANRTFGDSVSLAGAGVARCVRSGAIGIVQQPSIYASKHGPIGFVKGVGKAIVGAVVKPLVGVGDAAVLVMNHTAGATSKKQTLPKIPKRLRRALPCRSTDQPNCVRLVPYDERAAKAQNIVTGKESVDDVYLGHITIQSHLIVASDQCLWAIDKRTREPFCVSWEEISHFGLLEGGIRVVVFSQTGLKTFIFDLERHSQGTEFYNLLSMQNKKMANSSDLNSSILNAGPESLSRHQIPGIKAPQVNHVFGSCNQNRTRLSSSVKDEIDLVEQCFTRVKSMGSDSSTYFRSLDEEAWSLVCSWGQVFSGLSSRRCIVASIINGTGNAIQIKSTKLVEGGSPCYSIPTKEFDTEQGILNPGGVIIFFGWGVVPNLLQAGRVFMHIETSGFIGDLSDQKSRETYAEAMPGFQVGFIEKSYDDSGWWAKYWLVVRAKK